MRKYLTIFIAKDGSEKTSFIEGVARDGWKCGPALSYGIWRYVGTQEGKAYYREM